MALYFNTAIAAMIMTGLTCFVIGLITTITSYTKKKKHKLSRGWTLSIIGALITVFFSYMLASSLHQLSIDGESYLTYSWVLIFFFFPVVILILFIFAIFFLSTSVISLQEGYKKDENGKRDVASIVLGYVMLFLMAVIIVSMTLFLIAAFGSFREGLRKSNKSYPSPESVEGLRNYLFSIIYK